MQKNQIPHKVVHLQTNENKEYILIQWRVRGYEGEKTYTLHLCDLKANLISSKIELELIVPHEQRHRYAPYFHGFMPLIVYGISVGAFKKSYGKKVRLSLAKLDSLFNRFLKDYSSGMFDSYVISAPEIGKIVKGHIKNE